jgi:16S rRNA (cytosine1402-N4)-methyltransferase
LFELQNSLLAAEKVLKPKGRLAVITFHGLEDHIVKDFFKARCRPKGARNKRDESSAEDEYLFVKDVKVLPTPKEVQANPRARSAKLRCGGCA